MKVCLVIPPSATEFGDPDEACSEFVQQRVKEAPLGILAVAAVVRRAGYEMLVVDLNNTYYDYFKNGAPGEDFCDFAADRLRELHADLCGFGSICSSYPFTLRLADALRRRCPSTVIVAGGPQATVVDQATLLHFPSVDAVFRGEADESFPAYLDCLRSDRSPVTVHGITFRDGRRICRNPNAPPVHDMDALPLPAYDLFQNFSIEPSLSIEAGRGCPFACTFCSTNDFFRRSFRLKSPETLIRQMCELEQRFGARAFDLVHDMFTVDHRRVVEICEAFLRTRRGFEWSCSARTDCVDEELLELMARAGCRGIFYGIESGSPRMQRLIEKDLDVERSHAIIEKGESLDIPMTISLIAGFPDEERGDLEKTVDFIGRVSRLDGVSPQVHFMAPLAETPVHARFRDALALDDIFSDLSHQGWYQHPADRVLIAAYPEIFPNFYGLPSRLDRPYVGELCRFLYYSLAFCRWLVIGAQRWFGPLDFFDAWLEWRRRRSPNPESGPRYYASTVFRLEFPAFVAETYDGPTNEHHAVRTLAAYELEKFQAGAAIGTPASRPAIRRTLTIKEATVLQRARDVGIFQVVGNVPAILASLVQRTPAPEPDVIRRTMSIRASDNQLHAAVEPETVANALLVFETPRRVGEARGIFCELVRGLDGIPPDSVFGFTIKNLLERGLLSVHKAARSTHRKRKARETAASC
jgi:radical SAM superfamily enzyme YgiQ (UPF0313 family)